MTRSRSSARLVLLATVLVTAILAATGVTISLRRDAAINGFREAVTALGDAMAPRTSRWLMSLDKVLAELQAETTQGGAPDARPRRAATAAATLRAKSTFDALTRDRKSLAGVTEILLIDAAGQIANSTRAWPAPRADLGDLEVYRHFHEVDDKGLYVSTPTTDRAGGEKVVLLARRIDDEAGGFFAVAAVSVAQRDLETFFQEMMPADRSVALLRSDGVVLAGFPRGGTPIGQERPAASAWRGLVASGGGLYEGPGTFDPAPVVASVHPLPGLPFVIETAIPEDTVLASWRRQRPWIVMAGLIAIVVVLLLMRLVEADAHRLERSEASLAERNGELESARLQLNVTLTNMSQGVCFFDGAQKLIVCNRRYAEIYALPAVATRPGTLLAEIVAFSADAGCSPTSTRDAFPRLVDDDVRCGEPRHSVVELKNRRSISVHLQPMPDGGWVATHEDITEQRQAEAKITFMARHDALTGLANRALFQERMEQAVAGAARGAGFAVLYLDLDRFKAVNDTLGHHVGDELLRAVAGRLKECVRAVDTVARLGGDEFAILKGDLGSPDDVARLAERIVDVIARPYAIAGHEVVVGTSVGIALAPGDGCTAEILIKNADLALYLSKSEGRGTFRFFEPEMDANAQNRLRLERELRDAITRGEFALHYQPIVDLRSGALLAFEALIRWNHPERGLLGPVDFLATAEACGLIAPIGEWALEQACARARTWPRHVRVAVNLSAAQFRRADVGELVSKTLRETGLAAERLELDITEAVLLQHTSRTLETLHKLRDLGVHIVLDDFGVGQSSLSCLHRFPFDKVKIDGQCIRDIGQRQDMLFVVRAILRLCADLGIGTLVEGVETSEQRELLLREHCEQAQGFLLGRPLPADELAGLIAEGGVATGTPNAMREFARAGS